MRRLGIVGGVAATLLGATVVMAASPAPVTTTAPVKTTAPVTTPAPAKVATPVTTPAPAATAAPAAAAPAAANSWSAAVAPLTLQGTATFAKHSNGTATLSMKMQGLDPLAAWTVTVMPGGTGTFGSRAILFRWTSRDIDRLGSGTLSVHLTAAEYRSIVAARNAHGLVALVSDGSRDALATFPKA